MPSKRLVMPLHRTHSRMGYSERLRYIMQWSGERVKRAGEGQLLEVGFKG